MYCLTLIFHVCFVWYTICHAQAYSIPHCWYKPIIINQLYSSWIIYTSDGLFSLEKGGFEIILWDRSDMHRILPNENPHSHILYSIQSSSIYLRYIFFITGFSKWVFMQCWQNINYRIRHTCDQMHEIVTYVVSPWSWLCTKTILISSYQEKIK